AHCCIRPDSGVRARCGRPYPGQCLRVVSVISCQRSKALVLIGALVWLPPLPEPLPVNASRSCSSSESSSTYVLVPSSCSMVVLWVRVRTCTRSSVSVRFKVGFSFDVRSPQDALCGPGFSLAGVCLLGCVFVAWWGVWAALWLGSALPGEDC